MLFLGFGSAPAAFCSAFHAARRPAGFKGFAKGREEGREEERAIAMKEKLEAARRYLESGVPVEVVIAASGLSEEQVKNLSRKSPDV